MLLGLEFVEDEVLDGRGIERGGKLSVPDFLRTVSGVLWWEMQKGR
jgi:hypothetical protein